MAPLIVAAKLETLRTSLARIELRMPSTPEELAANPDLQESVVLNLAIHRYDDIDWALVHRVCRESLDDLRAFAREVEAWLGRGGA